MNEIVCSTAGGSCVLHLVGDVGPDAVAPVERALTSALGSTGGGIVLDLSGTAHLHHTVADWLIRTARARRRVRFRGADPYVRQILRAMGGWEPDSWDQEDAAGAGEDGGD